MILAFEQECTLERYRAAACKVVDMEEVTAAMETGELPTLPKVRAAQTRSAQPVPIKDGLCQRPTR